MAVDADLLDFADGRRSWIERDLGLDKMRKFEVSNPWNMPSYRKVEVGDMVWDSTTRNASPTTFETKDIKIETYKYREDYKEFYDQLTYRQDEIGNLLAKRWDREFAKQITKTLLGEEEMNRNIGDTLDRKMGDVVIGEAVVYFRSGNINFDESRNKDMWYVEKITGTGYDSYAKVTLLSISRDNHRFETNINNILRVEALEEYNLVNAELFSSKALAVYNRNDVKTNNTVTEDTKKMNSRNTGNMVKRTTDANVNAAKVAATITAGKTLNTLVASKITPQLPFMVRGYADTAVGRVVVANIADFAVKQFMAGNPKANMATDAMMQAAMLELADSFDLEGIVNEIVDSVSLDLPEDAKA